MVQETQKLTTTDPFRLKDTWRLLCVYYNDIPDTSRYEATSEAEQRQPVHYLFLTTSHENVIRIERTLRLKATEAPQARPDIFVGTEQRYGVYGHIPPKSSDDLEKDVRSNMVLCSPAADSFDLMVCSRECSRTRRLPVIKIRSYILSAPGSRIVKRWVWLIEFYLKWFVPIKFLSSWFMVG
jgi:hypothetical protein